MSDELLLNGTLDEIRDELLRRFGTRSFRVVDGVIELELPSTDPRKPGPSGTTVVVRVPLFERWTVQRPMPHGPWWHAVPEGATHTVCTIPLSDWSEEVVSDETQAVTCPWCRVRLIALEIVSPPGPRGMGQEAEALDFPPGFGELIAHMDELAGELGVVVQTVRTGKNYRPAVKEDGPWATSGIGVYHSSRGVEFNLQVFRDLGEDVIADDLLDRIRRVSGGKTAAPDWPAVPCTALVQDWVRTRAEVMEPYFRARASHAAAASGRPSSGTSGATNTITNQAVSRLGVGAVTSLLEKRGVSVRATSESRLGNTLDVSTPDGTHFTLYVKTKRAGDWQTDTKFAIRREPIAEESRFWVLVDLASVSDPGFYVVPEWWMQNDIYEAHQRYLDAHGGRRAGNPDSTHHAIGPARVESWSERWDLLEL